MALTWQDIRKRAYEFVEEWKDETREHAEAKTFLDQFFNVFGINRRKVAVFEQQITRPDGTRGYMDLLMPGKILIEMKSSGKSLIRAYDQARDYFQNLKDYELPQYIMTCNFQAFRLKNLDTGQEWTFNIIDLPDRVELFDFLVGYGNVEIHEQDPVNIKAAEQMASIHDELKKSGYEGHDLEVFLVRILFCMFADDTGIFELNQFYTYLRNSKEDGSDMYGRLSELFDVLNQPHEERQSFMSDELRAFPYVNGELFSERIRGAYFTSDLYEKLLECTKLDWSKISPAIFGSMFQGIMDEEKRRELGAHYTSEENIMKVIKPLFLDELYEEFEQCHGNKRKLENLNKKLSNMRFADFACGCGNFLVIAYREIRKLELRITKELLSGQQILDVKQLLNCGVHQFYGIEYEEFAVQVSKVAMWLMDHQMNRLCSSELGQYILRLPLTESATIYHGNALTMDWKDVLEPDDYTIILGNPPFVGARIMSSQQKSELLEIFKGVKNAGNLDYVSGWYLKSAEFIEGTKAKVGLVSTSSICQGDQAGILWNVLMNRYNIFINFAYRSFIWSNEARGKAAVHCIIVGFSQVKKKYNYIFEGDTVVKAKNINPYLVDAPNIVVANRRKPISLNLPSIGIGNKPIDGGNYLFSKEEMEHFIEEEPLSKKYFRPWVGAREFINRYYRYCLWVGEASPAELRKMPKVLEKIENVREFRLNSRSAGTRKLADTPTRFHVENIPANDYLLIPRVTSENRQYIPIGYINKNVLASDAVHIILDATLYHFGVLTSMMHMSWMRTVAGRLKSDYRYSKDIVYNNFPWPEANEKQKAKIAEISKEIINARRKYPDSNYADLYNPLTMPYDLLKAHQKMDREVDKLYRRKAFSTESERVSFLMNRYKELIEK